MSEKLFTHVLWLQKWEGGKFREWLPVGKGRILVEADGTTSVENFQDLTAIGGWNGYTRLMPNGVKPRDPESEPGRPARHPSGRDEIRAPPDKPDLPGIRDQ